MNCIYLDTLFFINFIADYLSLITTAKISGALINRKHIAIATIFGGFYACLCTVSLDSWLEHPVVNFSAALLICLISFGKEAAFARCYITFILVSAVFSGIISLFTLKTTNSNLYVFELKSFLLIFSLTYFLLSLFYRRIGSQEFTHHHTAEIKFGDQSISLTVLKDTGNELYDPITNAPILIIEKHLMLDLIPELSSCNFTDIYEAFLYLHNYTSFKNKLRLIPFQSISSKDMLIGIIPDQVLIDNKKIDAIIGITDVKLSALNQYQGIY